MDDLPLRTHVAEPPHHHPNLQLPQQSDTLAHPRCAQRPNLRLATLLDLRFITALQARNSNDVGFIPAIGLHRYITRREITIAELDNRPAAYLLGRAALSWQPLLRPITQICVDAAARRAGLARILLEHAAQQAIAQSQAGIQACCREDLQANAFWIAAGFIEICRLAPNNARNRHIVVWRKPLTRKIPLWFIDPPKRAGHHASHPRLARRKRSPYAQ